MNGLASTWTNRSVKLFAKGEDPVVAVVHRAREITLKAMEDGWEGPPFDPSELARWLKIAIAPREDIRDARTVSNVEGQLTIEFNPNQSRGRVRYSIAHEIAHTFFPDCGEAVRNRSSKEEQVGDEWQLELLCNIAAAELIMPMGTFPDLRRQRMSIDHLMDLRRQYDVSTEALLLRYIRLTNQRRALFAASRQEEGSDQGRYRIDYAVASPSWATAVPLGTMLREGTLLAECTAIGYTAKGLEVWPGQLRYQIECVGVPPFPNAMYPRVLGLLADPDEVSTSSSSIRYLKGDALRPRGDGPNLLVHVVNDRSKTWGGGFAKQVAIQYSDAQIAFRNWASEPNNQVLGNTHFFGEPNHFQVASMVAQRGFGKSEVPRISYPSIEKCLLAVRDNALPHRASVHMPKIGCGQAGGRWDVISEFVENILCRAGVPVTVYEVP